MKNPSKVIQLTLVPLIFLAAFAFHKANEFKKLVIDKPYIIYFETIEESDLTRCRADENCMDILEIDDSNDTVAFQQDLCKVYTTPIGDSYACCPDPMTGQLVCDLEDEAVNECIVEWAQEIGCSTDLCCELVHGTEDV